MIIENNKRAKRIKQIFYLLSIVIAFTALALFLLDYTFAGLGCVGFFSLWYLFFHVADYHYIEYSDEENKILLRFYKVISFGGKRFHSIEFPQPMLQNGHFENSVFGELTDLTFIIRTEQGIAEYPSVSLAAVPGSDRKKIKESIITILKK